MDTEVPDGQELLAGTLRGGNLGAPIVVVGTRVSGEGAPRDAATAAVWAIDHLGQWRRVN